MPDVKLNEPPKGCSLKGQNTNLKVQHAVQHQNTIYSRPVPSGRIRGFPPQWIKVHTLQKTVIFF